MYALDFQYDNRYLSDYGFMVCDFNGQDGANFVSAGSQITFEKTKRNNGYKHSLISAQYNECVTTEFDICKIPEIYDDLEITNEECRDLFRWLARKEFCKFNVLSENENDFETCYFLASFTIKKIYIREKLFGLHLTMQTDSPFGFGNTKQYTKNVSNGSGTITIDDESDEIGDTNILMEVTCKSSGNLVITNTTTGLATVINNCSYNEVITINSDLQIITSSDSNHNIMNDFNFIFFKISNSLTGRKNTIRFSMPCSVSITYTPIIKDIPH